MGDPLNDVSLLRVGMRDCGGVLLEALESYWQASQAEREAVCNGAGPTWLQAWLPWWLRWLRLFADRLWALNCREAFDIHDWDYVMLPATVEGKVEADDRLESNLLGLILNSGDNQKLQELRLRQARRYVGLVRKYGFKAYFDRM